MNEPPLYIPKEDDKTHNWIVIASFDDQGNVDPRYWTHALPTYGKHHQLSYKCWCAPDLDKENKRVLHFSVQ